MRKTIFEINSIKRKIKKRNNLISKINNQTASEKNQEKIEVNKKKIALIESEVLELEKSLNTFSKKELDISNLSSNEQKEEIKRKKGLDKIKSKLFNLFKEKSILTFNLLLEKKEDKKQKLEESIVSIDKEIEVLKNEVNNFKDEKEIKKIEKSEKRIYFEKLKDVHNFKLLKLSTIDEKIIYNKKILENKEYDNKKINEEKYNAKINSLIEKGDELKNEISKINEFFESYEKQTVEAKVKKENTISVKHLNAFYGDKQVLFDVSIDFPKNKVIAIIGPSGCGKSTFLKTLNRINDEVDGYVARGKIVMNEDIDILKLKNVNTNQKISLPELRTKIGMVFQHPNPFPMSIWNNIAYGPKINGIKSRLVLNKIVDDSLKHVGLYEEVKGNLKGSALALSGGQQQRLCMARCIANYPEIILMDEPTSALDPIAAAKVESLIVKLKKKYTIIMVTHSMQQAARISNYTAFFYQGKLIEYNRTKKIFTTPKRKETSNYIRGKFG